MSINEKLKKLYESKWDALTAGAKKISDNMANPLLLQVSEDYEKADVKVIIYGQETDGWCGSTSAFPNANISDLMQGYSDYLSGNNISEDRKNKKNKRPFWNKHNFKYFDNEFNDHYNLQNKTVSFLWNNISKIGKKPDDKSGGKPSLDIQNLERKSFNIIKDEVKILKPDVILFATGKSRDGHIKHAFGKDNIDFEQLKISFKNGKLSFTDEKILAKINYHDFPNILAFRFNHPNYRTKNKKLIKKSIKNVIFQFLDTIQK